ncbi:glycosyltransferase [Mucilaginibacter sp. BJC16-A38]|uniref:glycosyltransferase family 2 protein n=1 Tax=Mucilaginibacter phenanthrenivorans TaxID=1234842 RepID=UPI0021583E4B|nr:glycosyltransferase family 2 protein [Mucilaginibacter phenanthrenivorans]MCR8560187.1 glycosyltransferase [Mucilaginibacter phenanthrenivorans]
MNIPLPSLLQYKKQFSAKGLALPLTVVPAPKDGLLVHLPPPEGQKTGWAWTEETSPSVYGSRAAWPKITIVTPSYNQGQFIEQTIRSVLLQNYPNLEYIIIDGGSNDDTTNILKKYAPWLSYWQSARDRGQGHAINQGFSLATGDIYAWINSDDYYLKHVFFEIAETFLHKTVDFVYGYGLNYEPDNQKFELVKIMPHLDYFIKMPTLIQPSTFWHAAIHQPIWEELQCALDFELWLRLLKGKKRILIKKPLSVATVHEAAKTFNPEMKEKWEEDHLKIWSERAHGKVYEWKKIVFLNRIRVKLYKLFKLI